MNRNILKAAFAVLLAGSISAIAQGAGTGQKPADATGLCKDGTYATNPNKAQACAAHKGVKTWYQTVGGQDDPSLKGGSGTQKSSSRQVMNSDSTVNPHSNGAAVSPQRADAINKKSGNDVVATPNSDGKTMAGPAARGAAGKSSAGANKAAAPGGGPGLVWVNSESKTYHCYGSQYYGKTKNGKYVTEQEAKQAGDRPSGGKSCSK